MLGFSRMSDLRRSIEAAGGLYTRAGLARRWAVSRTIVGEYALKADFPQPIKVDGKQDVYAGNEADAWRAANIRP